MSQDYRYYSMLQLANDELNTLIKSPDKTLEKLYYKCIALIVLSRMRFALREKSELEVYKFLKELSALNKFKSNDKHYIAQQILENI